MAQKLAAEFLGTFWLVLGVVVYHWLGGETNSRQVNESAPATETI